MYNFSLKFKDTDKSLMDSFKALAQKRYTTVTPLIKQAMYEYLKRNES